MRVGKVRKETNEGKEGRKRINEGRKGLEQRTTKKSREE